MLRPCRPAPNPPHPTPGSRPSGHLASALLPQSASPLQGGPGLLARSPRLVLTSRNRCPAVCLSLRSGSPLPSSQPEASFQQMQPSAAPLWLQRRGLHPAPLPASSPPPSPPSPSRLLSRVSWQRVSLRRAQLGPLASDGREGGWEGRSRALGGRGEGAERMEEQVVRER